MIHLRWSSRSRWSNNRTEWNDKWRSLVLKRVVHISNTNESWMCWFVLIMSRAWAQSSCNGNKQMCNIRTRHVHVFRTMRCRNLPPTHDSMRGQKQINSSDHSIWKKAHSTPFIVSAIVDRDSRLFVHGNEISGRCSLSPNERNHNNQLAIDN